MTRDAEALLLPALSSGDPEVEWRLADLMIANGDFEAGKHTCRPHAPDSKRFWKGIYLHSRIMVQSSIRAAVTIQRAFKLAAINLANRPTLRALNKTL